MSRRPSHPAFMPRPPIRSWGLPFLALWLASAPAGAQDATEPAAGAELSIEQVVALVVERNERVLAAEQRAVAADARVARALAFFFPELIVNATYTRRLYETTREVGGEQVVLQRFNAFGGVATLQGVLLDARGFPLYQAALHDAEASGADAAQTARLFAYQAADAFLTTLSFEQVREAADRRLEFARGAVRDARARVEAQLASSNDLTRAELELASAQRAAIEARNAVEIARLQLANLLDVQPPGALRPPEALLADAARAVAPEPENLEPFLTRRLDVQAERARLRSLQSLAQEPLFRLLPALGYIAQYRATNEGGLGGRFADGYAGIELGWTLFDGGERYADRRERLALARAQALELELLERSVGVELQAARIQLANSQAALEEQRVASAAADRNAEETQVLYRQGLASALALTDASLKQFESRVLLARQQVGVALALLGLRAAAGLDPIGKEWPS